MISAREFKLPTSDQRHVIVGRTGGGKTTGAIWALSHRDFDRRPWIILDFKGERAFDRLPRLVPIRPSDKVPRKPAIYRMQPRPWEHDRVDEFLWRVWERGKTGVYVDEGLMLDKYGSGLQACLTQGRSLRIPMIILVQRPVYTTPFIFTQADHFMVYKCIGDKDYHTLSGYIGENIKHDMNALPEYHSLWYDVGRDAKFTLAPVPEVDYLWDEFNARQPYGFWGDVPTQRTRRGRDFEKRPSWFK